MPRFPSPGELFENRYQIVETIGTGGFAKVYRARQVDLERDVALKILTPTDTTSTLYEQSLVERFDQEAKLVSRLRDPHTITMFDYGRASDGLLYMVFEFIDGASLKEVVKQDGALEPPRVMTILEQAARSLQEAHAYGVMHRDIKPGNIMLYEHIGRRDQVKVLDFGIAKVAKSSHSGNVKDITADGTLVGTPRYMSPEQIRGDDVTPQSDIYSLGLVAYELLAGERAIASNSSITIIGMQLDPRPFQLPEDLPVPPGARYIVDKMLAKDREVRYSTTEDLLVDLGCWADMATETASTSRLQSLEDLPTSRYDPAGPSPFSSGFQLPAQSSPPSQNSAASNVPRAPDRPEPSSQAVFGTGASSQLGAGLPSQVDEDSGPLPQMGYDSGSFPQPQNTTGPISQIGVQNGPTSQIGTNAPPRTETAGPSSQLGYSTGPVPQQPTATSGQHLSTGASNPSIERPAPSNKLIVVIALLSIAVAGIGLYAMRSNEANAPTPVDRSTGIDQVSITTIPSGLAVEVNGRSVGFSPVDIPVDRIAFPALVAAKLDSKTEKRVEIAQPLDAVEVSFAEEVALRRLQDARAEKANVADHEQEPGPKDIAVAKQKTQQAAATAEEAATNSTNSVTEQERADTKAAVTTRKPRKRERTKATPKTQPKTEPVRTETSTKSSTTKTPTFMPMDKHE